MPTPKFDAMVSKVRDWANRDSSVLSDSLIADFLDYSADYCYRKLRIVPLEHVYSYPAITSGDVDETVLEIPDDFSELIGFSVTDTDSKTYTFTKHMASNEFNNELTTKPNYSFTFRNNNIEFYPKAKLGDVYKLHYYRRLADLDATYVVNQANIDAGNTTAASQGDDDAVEFPSGSGTYYTGNELKNWLRDQNERALLYGALGHAYEYLGEPEKSMMYFQKQEMAVQELNQEEKEKRAKGASNIVTFEVSELL